MGASAQFDTPEGLATDGTNLYVADQKNNRIRMIVLSSGVVSTLAGSGTAGSATGRELAAEIPWPERFVLLQRKLASVKTDVTSKIVRTVS